MCGEWSKNFAADWFKYRVARADRAEKVCRESGQGISHGIMGMVETAVRCPLFDLADR